MKQTIRVPKPLVSFVEVRREDDGVVYDHLYDSKAKGRFKHYWKYEPILPSDETYTIGKHIKDDIYEAVCDNPDFPNGRVRRLDKMDIVQLDEEPNTYEFATASLKIPPIRQVGRPRRPTFPSQKESPVLGQSPVLGPSSPQPTQLVKQEPKDWKRFAQYVAVAVVSIVVGVVFWIGGDFQGILINSNSNNTIPI